MDGMNALMRYAKSRGEGLLPELEELLSRARPAQDHENVVDFATVNGFSRQAGPNPIGKLPEDLPENVVVFRTSARREATGNTVAVPREAYADDALVIKKLKE